MKHFLWLISLCLCLAAPAATARAENRALLIGVGSYQISSRDLPGIDMDIARMREAAMLMGFRASQIKVLRNSQATLAGIRRAMQSWLVAGAGPQDRVLLYYSGHGSQIPDLNGDEKDRVDEVLVPHDVRVDRKRKLLVGSLVDDEVGQMLARIKARQVIVLLDACHSGTATKAFSLMDGQAKYKYFWYEGMPVSKGSFAVTEVKRGEGNVVALSAARDDEKAIATKQGSLFTLGFVQALQRARKSNRSLSLRQARDQTAAYIASRVKGRHHPHHPYLSGNMALADVNLIKPAGGGGGQPTATDIWREYEGLVARAAGRLEVRANKSRFKVGDELVVSCKVPHSGYLNILNVGPGDTKAIALFPNRLHPDNRVEAGETISIPANGDNFCLQAQEPRGRNLLAVFLTKKPVNAYRQGHGSKTDLFKSLVSKDLTRSFAVKRVNRHWAGKITVVVE